MEVHEGLKMLQDGSAGRVPHVKEFACKLNFRNFNFAVRPQPLIFADRDISPPTVCCRGIFRHWMDVTCRYISLETNKGEGHCSYE